MHSQTDEKYVILCIEQKEKPTELVIIFVRYIFFFFFEFIFPLSCLCNQAHE